MSADDAPEIISLTDALPFFFDIYVSRMFFFFQNCVIFHSRATGSMVSPRPIIPKIPK